MRALLRNTVLLVVIAAVWAHPAEAGPRLQIVVGPKAPRLERFAAQEAAAQFEKLYGANASIGTKIGAGAEHLVLLGSPATNPAVKSAMGDRWPALSDQGQLLQGVQIKGRPALVVGGGSPIASLWAVYELGHRLGIRYLLSGDVLPAEPVDFKPDQFDLVLEPNLRTRTWRTINDFAIGPESWGLDEHRRVLGQLTKLKFNRVMLALYPWQPFVHFEYGGVKKSTAMLWYGYRYPVDGDTPGRAAFQGAKEFYNPDLAGKESYEELTEAGIQLIRGVLDSARELGMSTAIAISPLEFPREFAEVLPEAKVLHSLESLVVGPGPKQPPDDPLLLDLVRTQVRAYLTTYPELDAIYLSMPEFPDWVEHYQAAWARLDERKGLSQTAGLDELLEAARSRSLIASGDRGVQALRGNISALSFFDLLLADGQLLERPGRTGVQANLIQVDPALYRLLDKVVPPGTGVLHFVDYTARRVATHPELLAQVPAAKVPSSLILTLADDNVGVLPQLATHHLHTLMGHLREHGWDGFSTRYWIPGDLDPAVNYLARASFDAELTPEAAYDDLVTAMCGPGVAERLTLGLNMIEQATSLTDEHDIGFAFPVPGMMMKHYTSQEPPDWWKQAAELYTEAMTEMYRAHDRSHVNGRPFLLHLARRCEFALEYLTSVEAVRRAGQAKARGDVEEQMKQLEAAVESMYNGLMALGVEARDNSDRGVIAVVAEYGYRPLVAELEAVQQAADEGP